MANINQTSEMLPFLEKSDYTLGPEVQRWHEEGHAIAPHRRLLQWLPDYKVVVLLITNLVFILILIYKPMHQPDPTSALYSPANHLISYKTVVFSGELDPPTKYMPPVSGGLPNDEVDRNWEDLYKSTIIHIPKESAAQLVNWTSPIPGDEGNYITMLDVFHQIHCLNIIRRSVYPERYHGQLWDGFQFQDISAHHVEHCIDSLRQLITCHSDVSTHYWRWNPKQDPPQTQNHPQVLHTCRDFEAIQEWAAEHLLTKFDRFTRVENPLVKV